MFENYNRYTKTIFSVYLTKKNGVLNFKWILTKQALILDTNSNLEIKYECQKQILNFKVKQYFLYYKVQVS